MSISKLYLKKQNIFFEIILELRVLFFLNKFQGLKVKIKLKFQWFGSNS